ncbi:MAG: hypothetical protein IJ580_03370, partial [Prevotella sp.]|nr:hypothetical protein [Prevotella sp.]
RRLRSLILSRLYAAQLVSQDACLSKNSHLVAKVRRKFETSKSFGEKVISAHKIFPAWEWNASLLGLKLSLIGNKLFPGWDIYFRTYDNIKIWFCSYLIRVFN